MIRSKEELIGIITDSNIDDELKISLLEDVTDSMSDVNMNDYVAKSDYDDLKTRYINRFKEVKEDIKDCDEEIIKDDGVVKVDEI